MTKNVLKHELDGLIETAQVIVQLDRMIADLEEDAENRKDFIIEFETLMNDFQRRCFRIVPLVKKQIKTNPEYKDLLGKLKDCIKVLGVEQSKISM